MKRLPETKQGEIYISLELILWAFFPIITKISYQNVSSLASVVFTTFFASLFFALIISFRKKWKMTIIKKAWKDILLTTLFIGILFYGLMFFALKYTSPGNAAIIGLSEVFYSFLFFNVWKKEYLDTYHIIGAILMIVGAIFLLCPQDFSFQKGDIIIGFACMLCPIGNFFQKRARTQVSSEQIMFIRSLLSLPFFLCFLFFFDSFPPVENIQKALPWLFINGFLLLGLSKIFWIESIHRISVTKAISLGSLAPAFTILFYYLFWGNPPTTTQILALIPMIIGSIFLVKNPLKGK